MRKKLTQDLIDRWNQLQQEMANCLGEEYCGEIDSNGDISVVDVFPVGYSIGSDWDSKSSKGAISILKDQEYKANIIVNTHSIYHFDNICEAIGNKYNAIVMRER